MATGGCSFYECSVCLSDMISRSPKLLQCHHSFCLSCIQEMVQNGRVTCPVCRLVTVMPTGGCEGLTSNFHLIQTYEREKEVRQMHEREREEALKQERERMKGLNLDICCQMCMQKEGVKKCQDCPSRMCVACTKKHSAFPQFKDHKVLPLCPKHDKGVAHICVKCIASVCPTCIMVDHGTHATDIVEFQQGVSNLREKVDACKLLIETDKADLRKYEAEIKERIETNMGIKTTIRNKYEKSTEETARFWQQYEESAERTAGMKEALDRAEQDYEHNRTDFLKYVSTVEKRCNEIIAFSDEIMSENSDDIVRYFQSNIQKLKTKIADTQKIKKVTYDVSSLAMLDKDCAQAVRKMKLKRKEIWLSRPKRILKLTNESNASLKLDAPQQILCAFESVFIANHSPGQVLRLDYKGNIMKTYLPHKTRSNVYGMAVYENSLYIHTDKEICKLLVESQPGDEPVIYKPDVSRIWKMFVVDSENIIITNSYDIGKIYTYNPKTNTTRVCAYNLPAPGNINVLSTTDGPKFVITMNNKNTVYVYDSSWKQVASIGSRGRNDGQLRGPNATAITNTGTILVADTDNDRICEFDTKGNFLRNVLTEADGIMSPYGLAYSKPYLWITNGGELGYFYRETSIQCFQIAEQ